MGGSVAYLRVAHPAAWWGAASAEDAARELNALASDRSAWSLFVGDGAPPSSAPTFAGMVLAGFWGWRQGKVPLSAAGYLAFKVEELGLTGGKLVASPANYTYRWPSELADAHWDLEGHTEAGIRELARVVPFRDRLQRVERSSLYLEQARLLLRQDCHAEYRTLVQDRMAKLARNEIAVFERVRAACEAAGVPLPAPPT